MTPDDIEVPACLRRRTHGVGAQRERVPAYDVRQVNGMGTRVGSVSCTSFLRN